MDITAALLLFAVACIAALSHARHPLLVALGMLLLGVLTLAGVAASLLIAGYLVVVPWSGGSFAKLGLAMVLVPVLGVTGLFAFFLKASIDHQRGLSPYPLGRPELARLFGLLFGGAARGAVDLDDLRGESAAVRAEAEAPIRIVAAVVVDGRGSTLLVRKRGSRVFIQPGGKPEPGETPEATLARELREELGVSLVPGSVRPVGEFMAPAVNEPGRRVQALALSCRIDGEPRPGAEIEEFRWVPLRGDRGVPVAPLSALHILPAYARSAGGAP